MIYSFSTEIDADTTEEDSSTAGQKHLYLKNNSSVQSLSYYNPYYVFLRVITTKINNYNDEHTTYKYTTKYMTGSRLKTVGLVEPYFTSVEFMDDTLDIWDLTDIYGTSVEEHEPILSSTDIEKMRKSYWYIGRDTIANGEIINNIIVKLDNYTKDFIYKNKDVLGRVSDETFIKCLALSCALRYNQLCNLEAANGYEIYNINAEDLLRLSICKPETAMLASPMSYARYVYVYGGAAGVYCAAILSMILWLGSVVKPLCTIIVFLVLFVSIFVHKVVLQKQTGYGGYVVTAIILGLTNILHAIILKLCTIIPDFGVPTFICLLIIAFIQVLYMLVLALVVGLAIKNWQDLGWEQYKATALSLRYHRSGESAVQLNPLVPYHKNNNDYYKDMINTYRRRNGTGNVEE